MMDNNTTKLVWDKEKVRDKLTTVLGGGTEQALLEILRDNSFLFYELYSRKLGIQPAFREVKFGEKLRCDFAWLNDNTDGPEWVLVEIESPQLPLFTKRKKPSAELHHAIDQVTSWKDYFENNPNEKARIFGAVARFRFILVVGDKKSWESPHAHKWRALRNKDSGIEIRSTDVFLRALDVLDKHPEHLGSFEEHPTVRLPSELPEYLESNDYIRAMKALT